MKEILNFEILLILICFGCASTGRLFTLHTLGYPTSYEKILIVNLYTHIYILLVNINGDRLAFKDKFIILNASL